ncbi:MAG: ABC transporter permease, partial [Mesorhizobium sp.]
TLFYATTFIFTGLSVAVAAHCSLFNIGTEGQAYIGGLGIALVCLSLDSVMPWWVIFPIAIVAAAAFGALWGLIPAYLQAKRGSHIVITTIMFNFIAASVMVYLLVGALKPAVLKAVVLNDIGPVIEAEGLAHI